MSTLPRRTATAITAAAAVAIGVLPVWVTAASLISGGDAPMSLTPAATSAGQVVLSTTSDSGSVTWRDDLQQFIGGQQCEILPADGTDPILAITGSISGPDGTIRSAAAGFRDGDMGVFEISDSGSSPNNAAQCFRVDAGSFTDFEALTLALDPSGDFSDAPFSDRLLAEVATVDVRAQSQSGTLEVTFLDASGAAIDVDSTPYAETYAWGPKTKSGSVIPVSALDLPGGGLFSGIRLTATAGSFSLRGATLDLVSQSDATFCNPGNPAGGTSTYTDGTTTVGYLGNGDESDSCFAVSLTSGDQQFQFLKPLDVSTDAQFVFDQLWTLERPETPDYALPKAYINFELDASSADHEMLFCPSWLYTDGALELVTDATTLAQLAALDMEPDVAGIPGSLGTQFACIDPGSRRTWIAPDGLKVEDRIFLIGDAKMSM